MEISKCLFFFRPKLLWFGVKSSSGQAPTELFDGNDGWWWWLSFCCSLNPITNTHRGLFPKAIKEASPGPVSPGKTSERSTRFRTYTKQHSFTLS